jgi:spermidine/putrescine transport system substrate-binding protein
MSGERPEERVKKILALCVAVIGVVWTSASAETCQLNLFIWSEYIDPEIVSDFEKEFRCKVKIDLYEDNETLIAKLASGGTSLYDVVVPSDHAIVVLRERGLVQPLRREKIPNMSNISARFLNPPFDPGNKYAAPYQWGTAGIYARKGKGAPLEESWGIFFDEAKAGGKFVLIDSMRDAFTAAFRYVGKGVNETSPEAVASAEKLLVGAKKRAIGFEPPIGGRNKVLSGAIRYAMVYNGDAVRGMSDDPDTYFFIPKEGSIIWSDGMAIPSNAPHLEAAEKFINFMLRPDVGARLSNFNQYATPNQAALPLINKDDLENPAIYPTEETLTRLEFLADLGERSKVIDEAWTRIKVR